VETKGKKSQPKDLKVEEELSGTRMGDGERGGRTRTGERRQKEGWT
jgi:hypothetical protein